MIGCEPWKDKNDAIERRLDQLEGRNIDHDQALLDLQVEVDNDRAAMEAYASAMLTGDALNDVMLVVSDELETKIPISDKGVPEGVATLDVSGKVPSSQIPAVPVALQTFTNSALGGIKGSATAGKISANADGTGSVNGWDTKANVDGQMFTGNLRISKPTEGVFYFTRQKNINDTWGRFMWIQVEGLLNGVNKKIGEIVLTHEKLNTNYTTILGLNLTTNYNDVNYTHNTGPRMNIINGVPERYFAFETRVNSQSTDGVNYSQLLSAQSDTITTVANTYARADAVGAVNGIAGLDATGKVPTAQLPAKGISDITGLADALNTKINTSTKGVANGVASLDSTGKVPASQLPEVGTPFFSWFSNDMGVDQPISGVFTYVRTGLKYGILTISCHVNVNTSSTDIAFTSTTKINNDSPVQFKHTPGYRGYWSGVTISNDTGYVVRFNSDNTISLARVNNSLYLDIQIATFSNKEIYMQFPVEEV